MPRSTSHELFAHRRAVREQILADGRDPYPPDGQRSHTLAQALETPPGTTVVVCGRLRRLRGHGSLQFADLSNASGSLQIVMKADQTRCFDRLAELDSGDFIRIYGTRFRTQTG